MLGQPRVTFPSCLFLPLVSPLRLEEGLDEDAPVVASPSPMCPTEVEGLFGLQQHCTLVFVDDVQGIGPY